MHTGYIQCDLRYYFLTKRGQVEQFPHLIEPPRHFCTTVLPVSKLHFHKEARSRLRFCVFYANAWEDIWARLKGATILWKRMQSTLFLKKKKIKIPKWPLKRYRDTIQLSKDAYGCVCVKLGPRVFPVVVGHIVVVNGMSYTVGSERNFDDLRGMTHRSCKTILSTYASYCRRLWF